MKKEEPWGLTALRRMYVDYHMLIDEYKKAIKEFERILRKTERIFIENYSDFPPLKNEEKTG